MVYAATSRGIFRTDNGGLSWGPASGGLTSPDTSWITGAGGRLYTATLGAGVFRSDDGGNNWAPATTGLPNADTLSLGVDPSDPQVVYAGTRNEGIFKTTDGGDSWVAVNNGLLEFATNGTTVFEGDYNQIAVDPNNPQTVFAMHSSNALPGNGIWFRSTNGGQQWSPIGVGASGLSVAVDPIDSNNIYSGTANGMARSQDGGETVQVLASFPAGVSANALAIDPVDPQTIYAASGRFFVFRSTDGGDTWAQAFNGLAQGTLLTVAIDPQEPSNVYTGSNGGGVFHTMDRGENWHLRSDGMGTSDVRALEVDPVDSANVIAGVFGGGAFRSTDSGGRWQEARAGLATVQLRDIAFAPSDPNIVFAGSVNPFASGDGSLFKSINGGMDWAATVTGISIFFRCGRPSRSPDRVSRYFERRFQECRRRAQLCGHQRRPGRGVRIARGVDFARCRDRSQHPQHALCHGLYGGLLRRPIQSSLQDHERGRGLDRDRRDADLHAGRLRGRSV